MQSSLLTALAERKKNIFLRVDSLQYMLMFPDCEFNLSLAGGYVSADTIVSRANPDTADFFLYYIIIIIINKVLIKVTLNKVIAGALYIVICG